MVDDSRCISNYISYHQLKTFIIALICSFIMCSIVIIAVYVHYDIDSVAPQIIAYLSTFAILFFIFFIIFYYSYKAQLACSPSQIKKAKKMILKTQLFKQIYDSSIASGIIIPLEISKVFISKN